MLLLNWNNGNSKSQMSLQSQVWHGAQFPLLKFNLLLFTNPILWKNEQFKCKCNLPRGADSRFAVSIANNHLQRGKLTNAKTSSCQAEVCMACRVSRNFPPESTGTSEPQLGRYKEMENWGISPDISSWTYYWLGEKEGSLSFSELIQLASLLKPSTDQFISTNIYWSSPMGQTLCLA